MRDRFTEVVTSLLRHDERLALVLADIGVSRFDGLGDTGRVFNMGIREQLLVGFAAGLALEGFRPIVHSYTPFLVERPYEQLKLDFGHQDVGGIFVSIGGSYDAAGEGRTHQSPADIALISTLPDWNVYVPGHADEVEDILKTEASANTRVYLRLSEDANTESFREPTVVSEGSVGKVVAVGPMLDPVVEATADLDVTVVYTSRVRPFPGSLVTSAAGADTVALVEPYLEGTSSSEVARAFDRRPHRLLSIGVPAAEHRRYGTRHDHHRAHGLDATGLRARIGEFLGEG